MKPTSVSVSSETTSSVIPVNWRCHETSLGLVFSGVTSGFTYSVQHTFDNIQDSSVTPTWHEHEFLTAQAVTANGNDDGNYDKPVRAIRLNVSAYTDGTCTLTVIQDR